jgi:hypothetical protein
MQLNPAAAAIQWGVLKRGASIAVMIAAIVVGCLASEALAGEARLPPPRLRALTNTSFELDTASWWVHQSGVGPYTFQRQTGWASDASHSLRVAATAAAPHGFVGAEGGNFVVVPGETRTFTARVNVLDPPANGSGIWAEIFYLDANVNVLAQYNSTNIASFEALSTGERTVTVTGTAPANTYFAQVVVAGRTGEAPLGGTGDAIDFYLDDARLDGGWFVLPGTSLLKAPRKVRTRKLSAPVAFRFTSDTANTTFRCKFDRGSPRRCSSPLRLRVARGRHTFEVAAVDEFGDPDPTPARRTFKILRRR